MNTISPDPRIAELLELAAAEGRPLAIAPAAVFALEADGIVVDPFTGACADSAPRHVTPLGMLLAVGLLSDRNQPDQEPTP